MKIIENNVMRDMTAEEEAEFRRQQDAEETARRQAPPTFEERIESQVTYTAMMTDTLLED